MPGTPSIGPTINSLLLPLQLVWDLAEPQYIWLNATLARVNRTETPWLILIGHRALYCTKTDDGECNSEAETLRDGFLGVEFGLEALCLAHGCDLVWSGHTHHSERTWPVAKGTATQLNYVEPRGPVYIQSGIAGACAVFILSFGRTNR